MSPLARLAAAIYYRLNISGTVPSDGPVLLVANHPNSLLDPMLVLAAAHRPVRFLAKAPLFDDPKVGWLVKAFRSIPVYRRHDDPTQVGRNDEMFRAVHAALGAGAAVALFPEGISHSEPSLTPLKTGAARIALGAAPLIGRDFPIVPVGLVFREKDRFRSAALVLVGAPVEWQDVAMRGEADVDAVRDLTERITTALRSVTVNLDSWHDAPLVETAVGIWEAGRGAGADGAERIRRRRITTELLASVRAREDVEGLALADDVAQHRRQLDRLGLTPRDLAADVRGGRAYRWAVMRLPLVLGAALALVGWLLFLPPYHVTGVVVDRLAPEIDTRSTWKLMLGAVIYAVWVVLLAAVAGVLFGWWTAPVVCLGLPLIGMASLLVRERWRGSWGEARRWLLLRSRRRLMTTMRRQQGELETRLTSLLSRLT